MYVVMNVLSIPEGHKGAMAKMFAGASETMKTIPGFLEFQFLDAVDENKQVVYTKWESEADFQAWTKSDTFAKQHAPNREGSSPVADSNVERYVVVHHS